MLTVPLTITDILQMLVTRYQDRPDDFAISIGHHQLQDPELPLSIRNLPEFCGYLKLTMGEIREMVTKG